jgi:proteasome accessory factor B
LLAVGVQRKALTVSRKSERLVSLTIALLATKRYLTKAEIFSNIEGYDGDREAKDRMFERDKDDLRSLGITIEVGSFDPLFEDEAGYRIKPESYALQLQSLDSVDMAILSQAARLWREAALGDSAQSGLRKLKGLGIESDFDTVIDVSATVQSTPEQIPDLIESVGSRTVILFEYLDENMGTKLRTIEPYRISNTRGYWYLIGRDRDREAMRTFRVDRITSSIATIGRPSAFEVDSDALNEEDSKYQALSERAVLAVRKGRADRLRSIGAVSEIDADWDRVEITYRDEASFIQRVLWYEGDVVIEGPTSLRENLVSRLEEAVKHHG